MKLFSMYGRRQHGHTEGKKNFQTLINRLAESAPLESPTVPNTPAYRPNLCTAGCTFALKIQRFSSKTTKMAALPLQEWLLFYERVLSNASYKEHINEVTNLIFDAVDIDANETLSLPEWQQLFQVYGIPVIYAGEAFASIALNGAHYLSKPEVLQRGNGVLLQHRSRGPGQTSCSAPSNAPKARDSSKS